MKSIKHGDNWGVWTLDAKTLTLNLSGVGHSYEIRLDEITDSAEMLDWIIQLHMKTWFTDKMLGDLIRAFQDIYRPQQSLCGQGIGKTIDAKEFLRKRLETP